MRHPEDSSGAQVELVERKLSEKQEEVVVPVVKIDDDDELNREEAYCRFCWVNDHCTENPLISSCSCSGGVKFVHFLCLRQWI
jgi:hypothetical protein